MKTVFLLDRSAKFVENCNETFDVTIREGPKQKKLQFEKTIWTWCLEGIFEMHRILSDVYPRGTLQLRFALADFMGKMLDTQWTDGFLTREELGELIETVSRPSEANTDITPIGGLTMAIEALAVQSPEQRNYNYDVRYSANKRTAQNSEVIRVTRELRGLPPLPTVQNAGNLIMYTRLNTQEEMEQLQTEIVELVVSRNKIADAPSNKTFCPITSLRLFIVNYYATGDECTVKTHSLQAHPDLPLLKIWVISRKAADMCDAIHSLLVDAFDLGSTTVTKIPMKEDNRGSSNYDVELFHSGKVHAMLKENNLIDTVSKKGDSDKGVTYDTMRLTWTTAPKTKWSLFPYHGAAVPCTTAQAYSRPSACLTQFVRDGRCVMLDSEKTTELGMNMHEKLVSHLLIANRGRIFIQEIDFMQKKADRIAGKLKRPRVLHAPEDPINMNQLRHTYKQLELRFVAKNRMDDNLTEKETEKWTGLKNSDLKKRFQRISKNIPCFAADTFIFNEKVTPKLEPLISLITKTTLSENDVDKCKQCIVTLYQMKNERQYVISPESDIKISSVRNLKDPDEQLRVTFVELAKHIMKYVTFSEKHKEIYKTYMTTLNVDKLLEVDLDDDEAVDKMFVKFSFFGKSDTASKTDEDEDSSDDEDEEILKSPALKKLFGYVDARDERKYEELYGQGFKKKKPEVEEKPIVMAKEIKVDIFSNMCDMLEVKESKIRREFVGRETHGNIAPLYPQLAEKLERPASPAATERGTERVRNTAERGGSGTPPPGGRRNFQ